MVGVRVPQKIRTPHPCYPYYIKFTGNYERSSKSGLMINNPLFRLTASLKKRSPKIKKNVKNVTKIKKNVCKR